LRSVELQIKEKEAIILKNDEFYKTGTEKLLHEDNTRFTDLEKRMELRIKDLLRENESLHKRNIESDNQIRVLADELRSYEFYKNEDIRETSQRVREEEKTKSSSFHQKART